MERKGVKSSGEIQASIVDKRTKLANEIKKYPEYLFHAGYEE
jgi:hypothetical protein